MNTIEKELQSAKTKMIKEVSYNGKSLAMLTKDNVAIVEAMIQNDSAYNQSSNPSASPVKKKGGGFKYRGSSAFWMTHLRHALINSSEKEYSYHQIIVEAVESVDRENSTHLNADGCGRQEIENRIYNFNRDELITCLKYPEYGDYKLIREIARTTSANKPRSNISFASKFCHYAAFYIFQGTEFQDNYSIYDSIIKSVLPLYLRYFEVKDKFNLNSYNGYQKAIDEIRYASGNEISRNGFDHLLWYYHKSRM